MTRFSPERITECNLPPSKAFTLIEVAIALGIASFALVTLVGILPVGLATQRTAVTNTVESQVVQQVTNDLLLTTFANLSIKQQYFFDYTGLTLATNAPSPYYTASVVLKPLSGPMLNPANFQTPSSSGSTNQAYDVIINVSNATRPGLTDTFSLIIANTATGTTP